MTQNAINNAGMASTAEILAGTNDTKMVSPSVFKDLTNTVNTTEHVMNLGFSYSAGVFTINAADGSALSGGNPGYIKLASKVTPGTIKEYALTSNYTATISQLTGNLFNTTTAVAYPNDFPMFVYFTINDTDTTPIPMFCPLSSRITAPITTAIGQPSSAIADTQGSMWAFSAITVTSYDLNPCVCIGSIRMQKDSGNAWTVQALDQTDGPLQFKQKSVFTFPTGQRTAGAGTYLFPATPPVFSSLSLTYNLDQQGVCTAKYEFSGDGGTDGSGVANMSMTPPMFADNSQGGTINLFSGVGRIVSPTVTRGVTHNFDPTTGNLITQMMRCDTGGFVTNSLFTNGTRSMNGSFTFQVDDG